MKQAVVLCLWIVLLAESAAQAKDDSKKKAKEHFLKGKALVEDGNYESAISELKASYELNAVPLALYNIGVSYDKLKKYGEAVKYYRQFLEEGKKAPKALIENAKKRLDKLEDFVAELSIQVDREGAEILIDGRLVGIAPCGPILLETGEHDLVIRKTGFLDIKEIITVVSGETTELSYEMTSAVQKELTPVILKPEKDAEPSKEEPARKGGRKLSPALFGVFMAIAGAAALSSVGTGVTATIKAKDVESMYDYEEWRPVKEESDRLALATDILIATAGAFALAALVTAFFTDFKRKEKHSAFITPTLTRGSPGLSLEARF